MGKEIGKVEKIQNGHKLYEETQVEWRITDFFNATGYDKSQIEDFSGIQRSMIESPSFSAGDASSLYFRLYNKYTFLPEYTSIYLNSKKILEYDIEYNFSLKQSDGGIRNSVYGILKPAELFSTCDGKFVKFSKLQSANYVLVPNNVLTITCTLKRIITPPIQPTALDTTKPLRLIRLDRLSENFKNLFDERETCDTTLKVKEKEYKVHRAVLMARSAVFAAAFKHDTSEKQTGVITIPDCDPDSFQIFLEYLYCGKLEEISFRTAFSLFFTSDKYDVPELKEFCVKYLMQCLTVENICEVVVLADKYDESELFSSVQKFFNKNACEIFETSEWDHLMEKHRRLANKLLKYMSKVCVCQKT